MMFFNVSSKWLYIASGGTALVGLYICSQSNKTLLQASPSPSEKPAFKWDYNWDRRDVSSLVKPPKKTGDPAEENKFNEKKQRLMPTATRNIFLIRHGQYELGKRTDEEKKLTLLGLQQADLVGQRLKDLNFDCARIIHSTMTRAEETSRGIEEHFKDVPVESSDLLREGYPIQTEPPLALSIEESTFHEDGPRIEGAFRKYFYRASVTQEKDSNEIIVCHGNVIRYFVCRLMQAPPECWLRFTLHHCSITLISIFPTGCVAIRSVGDIGFMPKAKMTLS